jgi:hypothetical protein
MKFCACWPPHVTPSVVHFIYLYLSGLHLVFASDLVEFFICSMMGNIFSTHLGIGSMIRMFYIKKINN